LLLALVPLVLLMPHRHLNHNHRLSQQQALSLYCSRPYLLALACHYLQQALCFQSHNRHLIDEKLTPDWIYNHLYSDVDYQNCNNTG
jgi:hypothetical protein